MSAYDLDGLTKLPLAAGPDGELLAHTLAGWTTVTLMGYPVDHSITGVEALGFPDSAGFSPSLPPGSIPLEITLRLQPVQGQLRAIDTALARAREQQRQNRHTQADALLARSGLSPEEQAQLRDLLAD